MAVEKWNLISSKVVFEHPRMLMQEDTVELPNGKQINYLREVPGTEQSVAVVAVNDKDEILLQQEYSYPTGEILWQLPGGKFDESEEITAAAKRELLEESDVAAGSCELLGYYYVNNRRSDRRQYVVLSRYITHQRGERDPEEFIESFWKPVAEVRRMIREGEFVNGSSLAALNLYFNRYPN